MKIPWWPGFLKCVISRTLPFWRLQSREIVPLFGVALHLLDLFCDRDVAGGWGMVRKSEFGNMFGVKKRSTLIQTTELLLLRKIPEYMNLISVFSGCWNEEIIRENFVPDAAEKILRVPLCSEMPMDRLIWKESSSGIFSVKSAYDLAVNNLGGSVGEDQDLCVFWKKLWSAQATQRSKLFLWRLCHKALPVKLSLRRRGFQMEDSCSICRLLLFIQLDMLLQQ